MTFLHRDEVVKAILAEAKERIKQYAGKNVELRIFEVVKKRRLSRIEILQCLCEVWGVLPQVITSTSRQRERVIMRSVICFFMRSEGFTFSNIGESINRDHTSAIHLINLAKQMLDTEDELYMHYYELAEPVFKYLATTDEPKQIPHNTAV